MIDCLCKWAADGELKFKLWSIARASTHADVELDVSSISLAVEKTTKRLTEETHKPSLRLRTPALHVKQFCTSPHPRTMDEKTKMEDNANTEILKGCS
jgi:hypothetical protein